MRKLFALTLAICGFLNMYGQYDDQMKEQRRDFFRTMPISSSDIVFIGNSITNGGEWQEFFPELNIINRGISGDRTTHTLNQLQPILEGKPQKVFIKIGTNDGPSDTNNPGIASRIAQIIDSFLIKSPDTKVYIQSVLPRNGNQSIRDLNSRIQSVCETKGVTYLNVYSELKNADSTSLNANYHNDGLHLLGSGYSKWARFLKTHIGATKLGIDTVESVTQISGLNANYTNQRATLFGTLKGTSSDILFVGDDVIDCVEWREMFRNKNVKGRGTGVSVSTSLWINQLATVLQNKIYANYQNVKPAKVFIYAGANDMVKNGKDENFVTTHMKTMVDFIRQQSSQTEVYIQGYLPHSDSNISSHLIRANNALKTLAESYPSGVTYIDLFGAFKQTQSNAISGKYTLSGNALNAKGFLHWAQVVAPYVDANIAPVPEPESIVAVMPEKGPLVSNNEGDHWYYVKAQRGAGGEQYMTANTDNTITQGAYTKSGYQHWRVVEHEDGFILQNRITGTYLNSAGSGLLTHIKELPVKSLQFRTSQDGTIAAADRDRYFYLENIGATATSATFRLHATNSGYNFRAMNWAGNANDHSSWHFIVADENDSLEEEQVQNILPDPLVHIPSITLNGNAPYRLSDKDWNLIKDLEEGTIVLTLRTESISPTGVQYLFASSDTTTNNYTGVTLNGQYVRIQYMQPGKDEGWFTASGTTPSYATDVKVVYRATKSNGFYNLNVNQNYTKTFEAGTYLNYQFIKNYLGDNSSNAFYVGGVATGDNKNKFPLKGTITNFTVY
ncbi:MAG: GDSL-type esterase/lipase family protein, partial [Bacteroidales bacterium]